MTLKAGSSRSTATITKDIFQARFSRLVSTAEWSYAAYSRQNEAEVHSAGKCRSKITVNSQKTQDLQSLKGVEWILRM
jgi:hypothetical protein